MEFYVARVQGRVLGAPVRVEAGSAREAALSVGGRVAVWECGRAVETFRLFP